MLAGRWWPSYSGSLYTRTLWATFFVRFLRKVILLKCTPHPRLRDLRKRMEPFSLLVSFALRVGCFSRRRVVLLLPLLPCTAPSRFVRSARSPGRYQRAELNASYGQNNEPTSERTFVPVLEREFTTHRKP